MTPPRRRQPAVLPKDVSRWVFPIHDVDDVDPPVQDREILRVVVFFLQESSTEEGQAVAADNELTNRIAVWVQFCEPVDHFVGLRMEVRPFENTPGDRMLELWEAPPLQPEETQGLRRAGLYIYPTNVMYRFPADTRIFRLAIQEGRSLTVREMLTMIGEHRMQDFWFEHRPEGPRRFIGHRDFWMQFFIRLLERRVLTGGLARPEGAPETPRPATVVGVLTRRWFPDGESDVLPIETGRFPQMIRWTTPSMQYLSELNMPRREDSDADTEMTG